MGDKGLFKIHISDRKTKDNLSEHVFKYRHFENLFIIFLSENREDFNKLSDFKIMRAVLGQTPGGKLAESVKYINDRYRGDVKLEELIVLGEFLNSHNVAAVIKRVKAGFKSFFTKIKNGDGKARPPKAKKLKKVNKYSIPVDKESWSIKKADKIGINLGGKMFYIPFKHKYLDKLAKGKENIQNISIVYSNGDVYLSVLYNKQENTTTVVKEEKYAGIDLGINNLCALFIDDDHSESLLLKGTKYVSYNADFNRRVGKKKSLLSQEAIDWEEKNDIKYPKEYSEEGKKIKGVITHLFEKRNRYFTNEFHKASKRLVEYLIKCGVTTLVISRSLSFLKNKGSNMGKVANQKFIELPILKLLDYIEMKCNSHGITVRDIDEAYTSKCSCITDDVNNPLSNELNGVRSKRGLFTDRLLNKIWNADLNGAVNHIRKYLGNNYTWLEKSLFKLCNPVTIERDYDFCLFIDPNRKSNKVKIQTLDNVTY
jgi:IS605 OrfB family transposase